MPNPLSQHLTVAFGQQAKACAELGSNFTALLCALIARDGLPAGLLSERLNAWEGDLGPKGASLPLRLMGAFHHLVLTNADQELVAAFPPNIHPGEVAMGNLVQRVLTDHEASILTFIDQAPQTNETGRSAALFPAFLLLSQHFNMPLCLSELGASAGLNLNWDKYAYRYGTWQWGADENELHMEPKWRGPALTASPISTIEKAGCDVAPFSIATDAEQLRLLSYVWADQHDRKERLTKALKTASVNPPNVTKSDAVKWLKKRLSNRTTGQLHVLYHSIAWQYFSEAAQIEGTDFINEMGSQATAETPLAWLSMENDGRGNGAALSLSVWDGSNTDGFHFPLGRADFHGRWVEWTAGTQLEIGNG